MFEKYAHKMKTPEEVKAIVDGRPAGKKVIMCHGTFDIVHPGHLRHLVYAKEKADILIVSVTCDRFVPYGKGPTRPVVPERLRAANLAALEVVDYVIIDKNPTPIESILLIQPDYFAKGFEYLADTLPPKTQEEVDALASYGGEMVFTPGDIVYSSSALLSMHDPDLTLEKLMSLMDAEKVTLEDLRTSLHRLSELRVHVVGDTIVDRYTYCSILGPSQKSPAFSVRHENSELFAGGAAVVAKHIRSFGAQVSLTTVLGADELREFVLKDVGDSGIEICPIVDRSRPTTQKERFIADGHKMLQVDRVDNRIISDRILHEICSNIRSLTADIVIFADYRHGIFHPSTIGEMTKAIAAGVLRAADSQVSNRWGNILDFVEFDLITPNEREARFALGDQDSVVRPLAQALYNRARCKHLILKLGVRGILGLGPMPHHFFIVDSFVRNLVDPIGAGDALLAMSALSLAQSGNFVVASILGSLAAAVACESRGNGPVSVEDMERRISSLQQSISNT